MNRRVRAVVFDWNGTVLDDVDFSVELLNELLVECNHPTVDKARYLEVFGFPIKAYYEAAGFDFSKEDYVALADRYIPRYESGYKSKASIFKDVDAVLDELKSRGVATALLSVTKQEYLDSQVAHFGYARRFDRVVGQTDHYGGGKADMAKVLIESLGLDAKEVLFVGDTVHDAEVARAVGAPCILVARGHQSKARLQEIAEEVVDSIADVLNALNA